jgi:glucose/arabinose dehydrogenase
MNRGTSVVLAAMLVGVGFGASCSSSDDTASGGGGTAGSSGDVAGSSGGSAGENSAGAGEAGRTSGGAAGEPSVGEGGMNAAGEGGAAPPLGVNRPMRVDFSNALLAQLRVPSGFEVSVFASALSDARMLALGPNGDIYVTTPMTSEVYRLADKNRDGDVDDTGERTVVASMKDTPAMQGVHGIYFYQGRVYLASIKSVLTAAVAADGSFTGLTALLSDLPDGGQHPNRTIAVGPDAKLYVSVGSDCNACRETNSEHATILRLNLDGTAAANPENVAHPLLAQNPLSMISPRVWASGLRNTIGFDWNPDTSELWDVDQGSDGLGEERPLEEFNRLQGGKSYGWPFCWNDRRVDPQVDDPNPMMSEELYCGTTTPNVDGLPAHSSPIAFLFYRGTAFPAEYRNDAFLVLRGSWNRLNPDGYKVVRVHFDRGELSPLPGSTLPYDDFLAGFLINHGTAQFGRIAGLTVDAAGSLLVSDDTNGMIYRVSYGASGVGAGGAGGGGG